MTNAMGAGRVIWITGLSGAGKTTVGRLVCQSLRKQGETAVMLDGDELRKIFPEGNRYDRDSRLALALSYARLCRLLAAQGLTVICATISMRREVFAWNRKNLPGYVEIFLDVSAELRKARDPKALYARTAQGSLADFAGQDQEVDRPEQPHLHLTPAPSETATQTAAQVLAFLSAPDNCLTSSLFFPPV